MKTTKLSLTKAVIRWMLLTAICLVASAAIAQTNNRGMLSQGPGPLLAAPAGSCSVNQLELQFRTGNDDLRGGGNDLNVEVHFADGTIKFAKNVNKGANWGNNSTHGVTVPFDHPVAANQIRQIRLIHLAQGGYSADAGAALLSPSQEAAALAGIKTEDNWDMAEMQAFGISGGNRIAIATSGLHRFTGTNPAFGVSAMPNVACPSGNQVTQLEFAIQTGNDDLGGGSNNLNITIVGDGFSQTEVNVNHSQQWANGSAHRVAVVLNHPVTVQQIREVILETTHQGAFGGGDNWNMDSVQIFARVNGTNQLIGTQGYYHFQAPKNKLAVATK